MTSISKYNNLTQRIVAGLLGSAGIIAAVYINEWTYCLIFFIICLFSMLEFYKLAGLDGVLPQKTFGTICGVCIFLLSFFIEKGTISYRYYFFIFPIVSCVYMIKLYKKFERKPFTNIAFTFLGIFYVAIPFSLLNIAVFENGMYNYEIIFGCLFILWASDTGAYFAGTFFGKRKLFERISPKKSWEGFFGGALLALVFAYGLSTYFHSLSLIQWIIIGIIIIVGGTFGDLVESLLKRSIEIKDSGSSIPGHGGFLDRFDGLLISAPFIVAYLEVF
ncbi:MAG: phosphatidate cytidylyltransferase [Cyclobacteriaceae bacterium]|jgi:phosphatidate cytidylyltransferase|nr:phosphatidate cytidylyltransferase [Cyclobacteriaceae bacterium]MDH4294914.1 phosphatidate cytidylyltransferase [Cyclobacteriaceae bacterium]MDH5249369.1 phosphatidate cytidylyltransferase [Cyclobacteriaceae bacterium]